MDLVQYDTQSSFVSVAVTWNRALEVLHDLTTSFSVSSRTVVISRGGDSNKFLTSWQILCGGV